MVLSAQASTYQFGELVVPADFASVTVFAAQADARGTGVAVAECTTVTTTVYAFGVEAIWTAGGGYFVATVGEDIFGVTF